MAFVPPLFKDLGKSVDELLEKKYNYSHKLELKTKTESNVTWTSTANLRRDDKSTNLDVLACDVNGKYVNALFGSVNVKGNTDGVLSGDVTLDKLVKGLSVKISNPAGSAEVNYQRDYIAVSAAEVGTNFTAAGVLGYAGLSVGGEIKMDRYVEDYKPADYSAAVEYSAKDMTVTLQSKQKKSLLVASYIHDVTKSISVGASLAYNLPRKSFLSTMGGSIKLDDNTKLKAKVRSDGLVSGYLEQTLRPAMKLSVSAQSSMFVGRESKLGLSLALGDD